MKKLVHALMLIAAVALGAGDASAADKPLTVVELYTSQGCSSCPPADSYLGKLSERDDIIALSLHVDYWDYIGWKDKFALPGNTERQRLYARAMGIGYVYTPQMVVQGMAHATGSSTGAIEKLIHDLKGAKRLDVAAKVSGGKIMIDVPAGDFDGQSADVLVAAFVSRHDTDVKRGENAGHVLSYYNVVRDIAAAGRWTGAAASFEIAAADIALDQYDGAVVLVQSTRTGRIFGAARIALKPQS